MTDIDAVLDERGSRYGKFIDQAAIDQPLKQAMWSAASEAKRMCLAPDQCLALEMIQHKIGRILNGDPDHADSWTDIAGYAQLVADRLNGKVR